MNTNLYTHLYILLSLLSFSSVTSATTNSTLSDSLLYYTTGENVFNENHYSNQEAKYLRFKESGDSIKMVTPLLALADMEKNRRNYSRSFDRLWEALYLTNNLPDHYLQVRTHRSLAILYDLFNMGNEAITHLEKAKSIAKNIAEKNNNTQYLVSCYMNLAARQRRSGNYDTALAMLDSSLIVSKAKGFDDCSIPTYVIAEEGYLKLKIGYPVQATPLLQRALKEAVENNLIYTANIFMYCGQLKQQTAQNDSALYFYNKALYHSINQKQDDELTAEILTNISNLYYNQHDTKNAYAYLVKANRVANEVLTAKNNTNGELFKVKNKYLESINKKNELLEKQEDTIKKDKQIQLVLSVVLLLLILLFVVVFRTFRMKRTLQSTLNEKKEAALQSKLLSEKNKLEIEVKSKELTSYALQLIDKERSIDELLEVVQQESPKQYISLKNKYTKGSKDLWNEFNLRFTEVNTAFYDRLQSAHPELSTTEQKHCALIKLNFSTKEMARILHIEMHSVHISRSRIRKKIGLNRTDSLDRFIKTL